MLRDKDKIIEVLNKQWRLGFSSYQIDIDEDYRVSIKGKVKLNAKNIEHIPFQFAVVDGDFVMTHNPISSLRGCPHTVLGDFDCSYNAINSLDGGPSVVKGSYSACANQLVTTAHIASNVGQGIFLTKNKLQILTSLPKVLEGNFDIIDNCLTTFQGSPEVIKGDLRSHDNPFESMEGFPKIIRGYISLGHFNAQAEYLNEVFLIEENKARHFLKEEMDKLLLAYKLKSELPEKNKQTRFKI